MENKCIVFYDYWQMQCCGKGFEKGQKVKWLVEGKGTCGFHTGLADQAGFASVSLPEDVDYTFDNHNDDYRELLVLEGTVTGVQGCYRDPNLTCFGKVIEGTNSLDVIQDVDGMEMAGYLISIDDYTTRPTKKSEVTFYMGRDPEATEVRFSRPEQFGVTVTVIKDRVRQEAEMFPTEGKRLTDGFLDRLLAGDVEFSLRDSEHNPYTMSFSSGKMVVKTEAGEQEFPATLEEFKAAFLDTVRKYSMYYAAPCNYPIYFFEEYDKMLADFEKCRPRQKEILTKLPDVQG